MPEELPGNGHASANPFAELRSLLVGPERDELADLRRRLDSPDRVLDDVSRALPEAILRRSGDRKLRLALHPIVAESIRVSVERDPRMLADALHPVIGKAVRKAVASALQGMLLTLNQIVEHSLSLRSISWRLEAWRTGKSFGEVLLLRSLLYRVEQVFLIHRKTGLLLLHRQAAAVAVKDADLVSAMLTAIQDFVRDSFATGEGAELDTVQVGEFSLWIQHGPQAILAGVVRGAAPKELQTVFQDNLWRIGEERAADLEHFAGDAEPFQACAPYLDACLLGQAARAGRRQPVWSWAVAALVLAGIGAWIFLTVRAQRRWDEFASMLRRQPGIVVTSVVDRGGQRVVEGLRDPLATDPATMLAASGLRPDQVAFDWQPYVSSEAQFVDAREFVARRARLENQAFYFGPDRSGVTPEQLNAIGNAASELRALFRQADRAGKDVRAELIGHTDDSGSEQRNTALGQARAEQVLAALAADGVPRERMRARGVAGAEPLRQGSSDPDRAVNRCVTLRILSQP